MSENNLLQFAKVISDHHSSPQLNPSGQRSSQDRQCLPIRKNACLVCGVCFTCSQMYGTACTCGEVQPRRGRNLPEGTLDSRAKKLHPQDKEDYAFSLEWLSQHAHSMYKDNSGQVVGLRDLSEVSLCKAHSSTLYRAKRRYEKSRHETASPLPPPPPPPLSHPPSSSSSSPSHHQQQNQHEHSSGGLAAKVREIIDQQQQQQQQPQPKPPQVDLRIQPSTSLKRKRPTPPLHSSASTPLYATTPLLYHRPSSSSLLPPLQQDQHGRNSSLSSLSSSLQEQLYLSNEPPYKRQPSSPPSPPPMLRPPIVETVSLKAIQGHPPAPPHYYFRNLAITDAFTFRDLLREIDMGPPPPNKRVVVLDEMSETLYPLDQAIRNVIKRPPSSHVELCLGLGDKASIDWSNYT